MAISCSNFHGQFYSIFIGKFDSIFVRQLDSTSQSDLVQMGQYRVKPMTHLSSHFDFEKVFSATTKNVKVSENDGKITTRRELRVAKFSRGKISGGKVTGRKITYNRSIVAVISPHRS